MKISPLFKGLSWLIGLNIIIKPIWIFGIDRQVQNIVGYEAYGSYFALFNLCYLLSFIIDLGLTNMVNRNLAAGQTVPIKQLFKLKLLLSLIYILVVGIVAVVAKITHWNLLIYLAAIQILTSYFVFFRNLITANQLFLTDAWLSVIDKFLMIVVCGLLIYSPALNNFFDLEIFLQIQTATLLLSVLVAGIIVLKKTSIINAKDQKLTQSLKAILPYTLILIFMSSHYRLDGFLLERLHSNGSYEAGVYASAFRLLDASNMVGFLAATFLVPFAAKNKSNLFVVENAVVNIRHALLICGIFITVFVLFFASWLQQLLYYSKVSYHSQVFILCLGSLPAYYITQVYSSILTAFGNLKTLIIIVAISVLINATINIGFIPEYGAKASCVAALVSQYFCAVACYITAKKLLTSPFHVKPLFMYMLTAGILMCLFHFGLQSGLSNMFLFFAGGIISACIMFVLIRKERISLS